MLNFEWDPQKEFKNLIKHRVSFVEAATIFADPLSLTWPDPEHSIGEARYITVGLSEQSKLLIVAHADRGNHIRIISARKATSKERKFYERGK